MQDMSAHVPAGFDAPTCARSLPPLPPAGADSIVDEGQTMAPITDVAAAPEAADATPCPCGHCTLTVSDFPRQRHGTPNGYGNLKCRCRKCQTAHAAKCLERRQERVKRGLAPGDIRHGTPNGYGNWGCRCEACTHAWSQRSADTRAAA